MVAGSTLLLAALLSAPAGDDRAELCADPEPPPSATSGDLDCSEPPPHALDCYDPRAGVWVDEMIGSCDQPRPPTVARPNRERPRALCDGAGCSDDSMPMRAASRPAHSSPWLGASSLQIPFDPIAEPLHDSPPKRPRPVPSRRLDRPPRA